MHSELRVNSFAEKSGNPEVRPHIEYCFFFSDYSFRRRNRRLAFGPFLSRKKTDPQGSLPVKCSESSYANTALMTHVSLEFRYDIFDVVVPNRF